MNRSLIALAFVAAGAWLWWKKEEQTSTESEPVSPVQIAKVGGDVAFPEDTAPDAIAKMLEQITKTGGNMIATTPNLQIQVESPVTVTPRIVDIPVNTSTVPGYAINAFNQMTSSERRYVPLEAWFTGESVTGTDPQTRAYGWRDYYQDPNGQRWLIFREQGNPQPRADWTLAGKPKPDATTTTSTTPATTTETTTTATPAPAPAVETQGQSQNTDYPGSTIPLADVANLNLPELIADTPAPASPTPAAPTTEWTAYPGTTQPTPTPPAQSQPPAPEPEPLPQAQPWEFLNSPTADIVTGEELPSNAQLVSTVVETLALPNGQFGIFKVKQWRSTSFIGKLWTTREFWKYA